jgi:hypothetical protein
MLETATLTPLGHQILEHWRRYRPTMVGNLERESTSTGDLRSPGVDGEPAIRVDSGSKDGPPAGVGDRDEGMGVPPGREGPASAIVRSSDPRPTPTLARDLRINSTHGIGEGGLRQKAHANLTAIRALKTIDAENRPATPEEKAALVRYTAWGSAATRLAKRRRRAEGSAERRGVHVGARLNAKRAQHISGGRSGDLASDGAVRATARCTDSRTVNGCRAVLWPDA